MRPDMYFRLLTVERDASSSDKSILVFGDNSETGESIEITIRNPSESTIEALESTVDIYKPKLWADIKLGGAHLITSEPKQRRCI